MRYSTPGQNIRGARFALYTVRLAKHGETIISYQCAMIAVLLSGPHSAHVPLQNDYTHTNNRSLCYYLRAFGAVLSWRPSYRGVSETYLILVGARTRAPRAATG